jgi:hypothetical protein
MADPQLNNSLTSMEWLYRLSSNPKHLLENGNKFNPANSASNDSSDSFTLMAKIPENNFLINKFASFNNNDKSDKNNNSYNEEVSSTTSGSVVSPQQTTANIKKSTSLNIIKTFPTNTPTLGPPQTSAQRAEPHRPIDLNAEYRGGDHSRREGKPPYSYVNLITFAINSTQKKRMTLNEIYQWIAENFHYYRNAGNGWKVKFENSKIIRNHIVYFLNLIKEFDKT